MFEPLAVRSATVGLDAIKSRGTGEVNIDQIFPESPLSFVRRLVVGMGVRSQPPIIECENPVESSDNHFS